MLAGYDTTAGSLSFLLYNLVVYPECQEKLYQEIQEKVGDAVSTDADVTIRYTNKKLR